MNPTEIKKEDINDKQAIVATDDVTAPKKGINLVVAIVIAIAVAMILAGVSLYVFMRSDARELIQTAEKADQEKTDDQLSDSPDDASILTSDELSDIEKDVVNSAASINGDDFSSSEMTDAALGL